MSATPLMHRLVWELCLERKPAWPYAQKLIELSNKANTPASRSAAFQDHVNFAHALVWFYGKVRAAGVQTTTKEAMAKPWLELPPAAVELELRRAIAAAIQGNAGQYVALIRVFCGLVDACQSQTARIYRADMASRNQTSEPEPIKVALVSVPDTERITTVERNSSKDIVASISRTTTAKPQE